MLAWRSWRVLLVALIPVAVFPLYGQTSCERACPASPDPCERTIGRNSTTGECVYANFDGADCDYQGVAGSCLGGQCLPAECVGASDFRSCDRGEGASGVCIDSQCIPAAPEDPCVKPGVGRINCCSEAGCSVPSGAYCTDPLHGVFCDPSGIEPADQQGQDGLCIDGACVALSGDCAGIECRTIWEAQCAQAYCNPDTGQCQERWVGTYTECIHADTNSPGVCRNGECLQL